MTAERLNIAVTGLNAVDNPGPGVPVIRCIRAAGEFRGRIIGIAYDRLDPGIYMDGVCDHVYLMPYPSEGMDVIRERLEYIHARTPIDVIIPTLDAELNTYLNLAPVLEKMGIRSFLPDRAAPEIRSKTKLEKLREQHGIRVPKGRSITETAAIYRLEEDFSFPLMVKGQFYDAYIAYSTMEVEHYFRMLSDKWGLPVVVQERIMGEEYDVVAVGDGRGGLIGAVPMKKMQLTDKGKAWGGITIADPRLRTFVEEVVSRLKWRGPCEIEVIKSKQDHEYYLIEINPRFPAWCYLSAGAGQNLPWAVVQLALGREVRPYTEYTVGALFLRHSMDMVYTLEEYRRISTEAEIHRQPVDPAGESS